MSLCVTCQFPTDQDVRCACGKVFCTYCHSAHVCGGEQVAQYARGPDPEPETIETLDPMELARALTPRPYQVACCNAVFEQFAGSQRTLVVAPTGTGKTVTFAHIAKRWIEEANS